MRVKSYPVRGSAAVTAVRNSKAFDPAARVHLRFVELDDFAFIDAISPGPAPAARRRWLQHYKTLEAQGREFDFIIIEDDQERGLVRMHDFADIAGEASFRWGDFVSRHPALLDPTAQLIYGLAFDTIGFARAHMAVPKTSPHLCAFHLGMGAELEYDDGTHRYFRFGADAYAYEQFRDQANRRPAITLAERA